MQLPQNIGQLSYVKCTAALSYIPNKTLSNIYQKLGNLTAVLEFLYRFKCSQPDFQVFYPLRESWFLRGDNNVNVCQRNFRFCPPFLVISALFGETLKSLPRFSNGISFICTRFFFLLETLRVFTFLLVTTTL